jgi:hypothetical protein
MCAVAVVIAFVVSFGSFRIGVSYIGVGVGSTANGAS